MADRSHSESALVQFSERLTNSAAFGTLFREGMDLVEETAAYLDGDGRTDAKALERAASRWIVSSDADEHVERIGYYVGLGFRHLVFHAPGPDQTRFLKLYGEHVLPRLRKRFG